MTPEHTPRSTLPPKAFWYTPRQTVEQGRSEPHTKRKSQYQRVGASGIRPLGWWRCALSREQLLQQRDVHVPPAEHDPDSL